MPKLYSMIFERTYEFTVDLIVCISYWCFEYCNFSRCLSILKGNDEIGSKSQGNEMVYQSTDTKIFVSAENKLIFTRFLNSGIKTLALISLLKETFRRPSQSEYPV